MLGGRFDCSGLTTKVSFAKVSVIIGEADLSLVDMKLEIPIDAPRFYGYIIL